MKQHHFIIRGNSTKNNYHFRKLENKWNERFFLGRIPRYNACKDPNILRLNAIKSKIRNENRSKLFSTEIKKSKTNYSYLTLESKPSKNLKIPFLITNTENEKMDLFSLKFNNGNPLTPYALTGYNAMHTASNKKDILKRMYYNLYDLKTNKTEQNSRIMMMNSSFQEEMDILKELWKALGVTTEYQINFWKILSNYTDKETIDKYVSYEKKNLMQLKTDIEKLKKEISKRENDLYKLKQIDINYSENEHLIKLHKIANTNENNENYTKLKEIKIKLEIDIENLLKSLRLHTINTVCSFSKFKNQYNYFFSSGKIDINQMKEDYKFDNCYLIKIKSDTNFLSDTSLNTLYDFSNLEDDPFFLSLLSKSGNQKKYKYLSATEDTLNQIKQCLFIIDQEMVLFKMNKSNAEEKTNNFIKINRDVMKKNFRKDTPDLKGKNIKRIIFNNKKEVISAKQSPFFNRNLTEDSNNYKSKISNIFN